MGALAGIGGNVKIGVNTVANIKDWQLDIQAAILDTSRFGDTWKEFIAGIKEWAGSFSGSFDYTDANGQMAAQAAILGGTTVTIELDVDGTHHYSGTAYVKKDSVKASVEATVDASYDFQGSGALTYT